MFFRAAVVKITNSALLFKMITKRRLQSVCLFLTNITLYTQKFISTKLIYTAWSYQISYTYIRIYLILHLLFQLVGLLWTVVTTAFIPTVLHVKSHVFLYILCKITDKDVCPVDLGYSLWSFFVHFVDQYFFYRPTVYSAKTSELFYSIEYSLDISLVLT